MRTGNKLDIAYWNYCPWESPK